MLGYETDEGICFLPVSDLIGMMSFVTYIDMLQGIHYDIFSVSAHT
jgi:hypothetical protein